MTEVAFPIAGARLRFRAIPIPNLLGISAFGMYLVIGAYLAFVLHAYDRDAFSRVASAYDVLFSRDPHLAAIGFVWMPLPVVVEMALLPAKAIFPALVQQGFAAVIMSASFMALAVVVLNGILVDFQLRRGVRLGLVAAFACHPVIAFYGAIGTSEAPTLFFALFATRYLARYVTSASTMSLVAVGLALAGGYLTRYEIAAAAVGAAGLILIVALWRTSGSIRARFIRAIADVAVAMTPFAFVFVGWALVSWIIVGSPFTQFSSEYGNSSQMRVAAGTEVGLTLAPSMALAALRLTVLSIGLPLALVAGLWAALVRRDVRVLAVAAVLGAIVAFMVTAYVFHATAPWLRYFIAVIPLGILLLGLGVSPRAGVAEFRNAPRHTALRRLPRLASSMFAIVIPALALASAPVAAIGATNATVAPLDAHDIGALLGPNAAAPDRPGSQIQTFAGEKAVADRLDEMHLPRGSVLLDVFIGFPIALLSNNPNQFVITPDRDFKQVLADPPTFGVRYLLVPPPEGNGTLDAINRTYPNLAARRDFVDVVQIFPAIEPGGWSWTLYRLVGSSP